MASVTSVIGRRDTGWGRLVEASGMAASATGKSGSRRSLGCSGGDRRPLPWLGRVGLIVGPGKVQVGRWWQDRPIRIQPCVPGRVGNTGCGVVGFHVDDGRILQLMMMMAGRPVFVRPGDQIDKPRAQRACRRRLLRARRTMKVHGLGELLGKKQRPLELHCNRR